MSFADPVLRPDIVVPDTGPLIHLAMVDCLHLLHEIGGAVIFADVVADEVTRDLAKPGARALQRWIQSGRLPGSNAPVRVQPTETGRVLAQARVSDPGFTMRNGGETAIVEWLVETVQGTDAETIVLYENGRVPAVIAGQAMDAVIDVVTTRAFLGIAERRGLVPSAADAWRRIEASTPTANPRIDTFSQRRPAE